MLRYAGEQNLVRVTFFLRAPPTTEVWFFGGLERDGEGILRVMNIVGVGRGGKDREETLEIRSLNNARAARARKGKAADLGFKPTTVLRVE